MQPLSNISKQTASSFPALMRRMSECEISWICIVRHSKLRRGSHREDGESDNSSDEDTVQYSSTSVAKSRPNLNDLTSMIQQVLDEYQAVFPKLNWTSPQVSIPEVVYLNKIVMPSPSFHRMRPGWSPCQIYSVPHPKTFSWL